MIVERRISHVYNHLQLFQEAYDELVKRIIDHLPDELKNNVDYVEEDAAYTGGVCINFKNWQSMEYESSDVINVFKNMFDIDVKVDFWMDGLIDDDRFAIMIELKHIFWEVKV